MLTNKEPLKIPTVSKKGCIVKTETNIKTNNIPSILPKKTPNILSKPPKCKSLNNLCIKDSTTLKIKYVSKNNIKK